MTFKTWLARRIAKWLAPEMARAIENDIAGRLERRARNAMDATIARKTGMWREEALEAYRAEFLKTLRQIFPKVSRL